MSDENTSNTPTSAKVAVEKNNDLFSQGDTLFWKCEYDKAKEHFQAILNQPSINLLELVRCHNSLGAANAKLQNYEEALHNYRQQVVILLKLGKSNNKENDIAKCYMSMGKVYWMKQDYNQAIDCYKQALFILPTITVVPGLTSTIDKDLANLYTKTQQFNLAKIYFEKALGIDRHELGEDHPKLGQTYADIGAMYCSQKDYNQALTHFVKARDTWKKSLKSSHVYIESMEKTIGAVQSKLGQASPRQRSHLHPRHVIRELISLQINIEPGWSVELYDPDDVNQWKLMFDGPLGTPYENGRFQLTFSFPPDYPFKPPKLLMNTKIFHPNFGTDGSICLDLYVTGKYGPATSIRTILKEIQKLFINANFDDFIFPEAAFLFKENRNKFHDTAVEWTRKYAYDGASPTLPEASPRSSASESLSTPEKLENDTEQMNTTTKRVVWLWRKEPSEEKQWHEFQEIETAILDKAYLNKEKIVELDRSIVNFDIGWQLNKKDWTMAIIIRISNREYKAQIRAKWNGQQQLTESAVFYSDPCNDQTPLISKCLSLDTGASVVANGIRYEGALIGKPHEANYIATQLEETANNDNSLIGLQCIHQYTRSSFLSDSLTKFLCEKDLNKVETLGPYLKLLYLHFKEYPMSVNDLTVYRGVNLQPKDLQDYKEAISKGIFRWYGFTSTSKSRKVAEFYNANTLMIIHLNKRYPNDGRAVDIAVLSQFPEEEEVLLRAGVEFCVEKVEQVDHKHLIYTKAYV